VKKTRSKVKVKEKAQLKTYYSKKDLDHLLYWTTLVILVVANFFMTVALIPFLFFTANFQFYLTLAVSGLFFGSVFSLLLSNISNLDTHHHIMAVFFIPIFSLINLIIITGSVNRMGLYLGIQTDKSPIAIGLFYVLFFIAPYTITQIRKRL